MSGNTLGRGQGRPGDSHAGAGRPGRRHGAPATGRPRQRSPYLIRIPVRCRSEVFLVPVAQVAAIVADAERLTITTIGGKQYVINYRLKDLESRLDPEQFVRLSRAALVNVSAVSRIVVKQSGINTVILEDGQELSMSRLQSRLLRQTLLRLS
jgi:two-component system, LytTR family, response regulator